jgi:hypothetical protein
MVTRTCRRLNSFASRIQEDRLTAPKKKKRMTRAASEASRKKSEAYSTVINCAYFDEIQDCIASGWPPRTVREYLVRRYGENGIPSDSALKRWKAKYMPEAKVLPHAIIMEKLKGINYKVDLFSHLSRLIPLLEERLGRGLKTEKDMMDIPLEVNEGVIRSYLDSMEMWLRIAQQLGVMPKPIPAGPLIDARTQSLNMPLATDPDIAAALERTMKYSLEKEKLKELRIANDPANKD